MIPKNNNNPNQQKVKLSNQHVTFLAVRFILFDAPFFHFENQTLEKTTSDFLSPYNMVKSPENPQIKHVSIIGWLEVPSVSKDKSLRSKIAAVYLWSSISSDMAAYLVYVYFCKICVF